MSPIDKLINRLADKLDGEVKQIEFTQADLDELLETEAGANSVYNSPEGLSIFGFLVVIVQPA